MEWSFVSDAWVSRPGDFGAHEPSGKTELNGRGPQSGHRRLRGLLSAPLVLVILDAATTGGQAGDCCGG